MAVAQGSSERGEEREIKVGRGLEKNRGKRRHSLFRCLYHRGEGGICWTTIKQGEEEGGLLHPAYPGFR